MSIDFGFCLQYAVSMENLISSKILIDLIEQFARNHDRGVTVVSQMVFGDPTKIGDLRNGGDILVGNFNKAVRWFSQNWGNYPWVVDLPRPSVVSIETLPNSLTQAGSGVY